MQNKTQNQWYATKNTVVLFVNGKKYEAASDHRNFSKIIENLQNGSYTTTEKIEEDFSPISLENNLGVGITLKDNHLQVTLTSGETVYLNGELFRRLKNSTPPKHIIEFLNRARKNPRSEAITELYEWLSVSKMPIDSEGYFYAYKRVRENFTDIRTGTMDNSPGTYVRMAREQVDPDRNRTCSTGLHFAAWTYLNSYASASSSRTVLLRIDPAEVVAIPNDYNNMKGRTAEYYVVAEIPGEREPDYDTINTYTNTNPNTEDDDYYDDATNDIYDDDYYYYDDNDDDDER